jgi:predicted DNA-binding mobile mystery protein A
MPNPYRAVARRKIDERLPLAESLPAVPPKGWIATVRDALGMSHADLARQMGVAKATVVKLEASEAAGTIKLDTIRRAAEAMGCSLRYVVIPESSLEQIVDDRARELVSRSFGRVEHTMKLEDQAPGTTLEQTRAFERRVEDLKDSAQLWRSET